MSDIDEIDIIFMVVMKKSSEIAKLTITLTRKLN